MAEISNNFLAVLLVIAIMIAIVGAWTSIDKVERLAGLTGFGTQGYVNLTIANMTNLNVTATSCDFGTGAVNAASTYAILASNGTVLNWNSTGTSTNMSIKNDGNQNVSVNVTSDKTLAQFLGGGSWTEYRMFGGVKEPGACINGTIIFATCGTAWPCWPGTNMSTTSTLLCNNLSAAESTDEMYVGCYLVISDNTPAGTKNALWTFTATSL